MFKDERDAAHQAVEAITNPTTVAIDAGFDKAEAVVADRDATIGQLEVGFDAAKSALLTSETQLAATLALADGLRAQLTAAGHLIPPFGLADIEKHPDWKSATGPSIGSSAPTSFSNSCVPAPDGTPLCLKLTAIQAPGKYGDVLWSVIRKPVPTPGLLRYSGRFLVDDQSLLAGQALEIDTKVIYQGYEYNFSSHINFAHAQFEIAGDAGWVPMLPMAKPAANVWHEFLYEYSFDPTAKAYTFVAYSLDGVRTVLGKTFPAKVSTWGEQVHPQLQWSLNQAGKTATVYFERLRYGG